MKESRQTRYIRLIRQPSLEAKAGFLVLLLASIALGAAFASARHRLSREASAPLPSFGSHAADDSTLSQ